MFTYVAQILSTVQHLSLSPVTQNLCFGPGKALVKASATISAVGMYTNYVFRPSMVDWICGNALSTFAIIKNCY
jgi:hypothetical protein